jgi:hypothetical protein
MSCSLYSSRPNNTPDNQEKVTLSWMKCPARYNHLELTTLRTVKGKAKPPFEQSALLVLLVEAFRVQSGYPELEE